VVHSGRYDENGYSYDDDGYYDDGGYESRGRGGDYGPDELTPEERERLESFRAKLLAGGLDAVTRLEEEPPDVDPMWAVPERDVAKGRVLLAEESFFFPQSTVNVAFYEKTLARVGLPGDLSEVPVERRNAVLPVLLLLELEDGGVEGLLLGRRSGLMFGDFQGLDTSNFVAQPLWVGGPSLGQSHQDLRTVGAKEKPTTGILALHPYRNLPGAVQLTDDGLCLGGDWAATKEFIDRGKANPFRFRLYAQATRWDTLADLETELRAGAWRVADVSTELLLKERDRGAMPLWEDIHIFLAKHSARGGSS